MCNQCLFTMMNNRRHKVTCETGSNKRRHFVGGVLMLVCCSSAGRYFMRAWCLVLGEQLASQYGLLRRFRPAQSWRTRGMGMVWVASPQWLVQPGSHQESPGGQWARHVAVRSRHRRAQTTTYRQMGDEPQHLLPQHSVLSKQA